ncbi:MAG TPA: glutathione S-transferase N-terminal domain-containing protein [Polyangiaceae bacterium]|nr:glutathione S-transferase N-terminal domain-containing protein [Polyangiaceae bacterium]
MAQLFDSARPCIVGRSSSHFTRVARVFALELGVACDFEVVRDLTSVDARDFAENPALKMPSLRTAGGVWFGALNICRELARRAPGDARVVWPEELVDRSLANAQELIFQAMASEVSLIMLKATSGDEAPAYRHKLCASLLNSLGWLESNVSALLAALPAERTVSVLEVTLFCLVTHVEFRAVVNTPPYPELARFCERFAERPSAQATTFRFDV